MQIENKLKPIKKSRQTAHENISSKVHLDVV